MILALGDCNIIGADRYKGKNYIDIISKKLQIDAINCGITMSTTREGVILFNEKKKQDIDIVIVAYGLVDSWKTFKYAPYVLYYPDNFFRKLARKLVKKYKKIARQTGLNEMLGQKYVVPPAEYEQNITNIISQSKKTILIETPPHLTETFRNPDIQYYNSLLKSIAKQHRNCEIVEMYEDFLEDRSLYFDEIHMNERGYELVAKKLLEKV